MGGGVGAAPLYLLFEQLVAAGVDVTVVLGAQTEAALVCRERYARVLSTAGCCAENAPLCATDDGTFGRAGFCTSLVDDAVSEANASGKPFDYLAVCGPEPLMKIVSGQAGASEHPLPGVDGEAHGVRCRSLPFLRCRNRSRQEALLR